MKAMLLSFVLLHEHQQCLLHVVHHLVARTVNVEREMDWQFVPVFLDLLEAHQPVDRNVLSVQIVVPVKHAAIRSVEILV